MRWFRPALDLTDDSPREPLLDEVRDLILSALAPCHFFVAPSLTLRWQQLPYEEIRWEIFQGRLLDPAHTRETRRFQALSIYQEQNGQLADEPLLSLKLDAEANAVHVVRGLLCYVWEGYASGGNVIESRETKKWVRELVGTAHLAECQNQWELWDELVCLIWQAVVGASRLPLTSLENPLPAFSLGQLAYVFRSHASFNLPLDHWDDLIHDGLGEDLTWREKAKLLETLLRATPAEELTDVAHHFIKRWQALGLGHLELTRLLRTLFFEVSLSPYTGFVDKPLAFVHCLADSGFFTPGDEIDFLSFLLRLQGRHLTAYDLFTFHHRGANYPDALLLEAVLARYAELIHSHPRQFLGADRPARLRRRAWRQGCLLRKFYQGHLVPDSPTSPGENQRVLPEPFARVPEEQLLNPVRRKRRLFAEQPLLNWVSAPGRQLLQASFADLEVVDELLELGTAVFIDRPLGFAKAATEPDQTPLLAHEVFSPSLAQRRLGELTKLAAELCLAFAESQTEALGQRLRATNTAGVPIAQVAEPGRPVPSLADARRVAEDFLVRRTLPTGLREVLALVDDAAPMRFLLQDGMLLRVQTEQGPAMLGFDSAGAVRGELIVDVSAGYRRRGGVEFPRAGMGWDTRD